MEAIHPVTLDENRHCHYPSPLRDDKVLLPSSDYEMPLGIRVSFGILGVLLVRGVSILDF